MKRTNLKVLLFAGLAGVSYCGGPKLQIKQVEPLTPQLSRLQVPPSDQPIMIPLDSELFGANAASLIEYEIETTIGQKTLISTFVTGPTSGAFGLNKSVVAGPGVATFGKNAGIDPNSQISLEGGKLEGILNNHPLIFITSHSHSYPAANTAIENNEVHPRSELMTRISAIAVKQGWQEGGIENLLGENRTRKQGEEWAVYRRLSTAGAGLIGGGGNIFLTTRQYKARGVVEKEGKAFSVIEYKAKNLHIEMISGELIASQAHFVEAEGVIVIDSATKQLVEMTANATFNTHSRGNVTNPAFFLTQPEVLADMKRKSPSLDLANALTAGGGGALGSLAGMMAANSGGKIIVETITLFRDVTPERVPSLCEFGLKNSNYPAYYATPVKYAAYMYRK